MNYTTPALRIHALADVDGRPLRVGTLATPLDGGDGTGTTADVLDLERCIDSARHRGHALIVGPGLRSNPGWSWVPGEHLRVVPRTEGAQP